MTTTRSSVPPPITHQHTVILGSLLMLAGFGWLVFLNQASRPMGMARDDMGPDLTMGRSWPLFLAMWVAMMFPAAAPMISMYGRTRRDDRASVAIFTGSYIVLWSVFGVVAYLLGAAVESAATRSDWVATNWGRAGGALLGAGRWLPTHAIQEHVPPALPDTALVRDDKTSAA